MEMNSNCIFNFISEGQNLDNGFFTLLKRLYLFFVFLPLVLFTIEGSFLMNNYS